MVLPLKESICCPRELPRNDDVLLGRAELLESRDRDLIEAVFIRGQSTASLGRMMGVSARSIRNRAARLQRHLTSRRFLAAARALPYLSREDAELAKRRFCHGATHRRLCRELGLTSHGLRRRLDQISAQIATIERLQRSGLAKAWRGSAG